MILGKLFSPKRKTVKSLPEPDKSPEIKKDEPILTKDSDQSLKLNNAKLSDTNVLYSFHDSKLGKANVVYPFQDVKATSFPSPPSADAFVFNDPQNQTTALFQNERERFYSNHAKTDEKEKVDEVKGSACDSKTCTKEKYTLVACDGSLKKQSDLSNKLDHDKLTEMINSSITKAMETIVKQCRMNKEEKDVEKKPKEECLPQTKHESRPRTVQDQCNNRLKSKKNVHKSIRPQERYNIVRPCPKKLYEESIKSKKENVSEDARSKRHSKSANVKTDNRRMTGNVNIYICSEANENAQATNKQKKSPPCAESSLETMSTRSDISSSKLMTSIRNKRRKNKEKNSLEFLPCTEESSDDSNACTCVTKSTELSVATKLASSEFIDVCAVETGSTSIECHCEDTSTSHSDKSDLSSLSTKFGVCENVKPCSRIYPPKGSSYSDSVEWSSKSMDSDGTMRVLCDQNRRERSFDAKSLDNDSYRTRAKRNFDNVCKCCKKDSTSARDTQNDRRNRRQFCRTVEKENSIQPWSTCNCIAEEDEEEDVCTNVKLSPEISVCKKPDEQTHEEVKAWPRTLTKELIENKKETAVKAKEDSPRDKNLANNLENAIPAKISESPGPAKISDSPSPAKISDSPSPAKISDSPSPAKISDTPSPAKISDTPSPAKISDSPSPAKISDTPSPAKISDTPSPAKITGNAIPAKISESPSPAKISESSSPAKIPENSNLAKTTKGKEKNMKKKQPNSTEDCLTRPVSPGRMECFPRLIRPETRTLQYILSKQSNIGFSSAGQNVNEPAYLKRFNLRDQYKFMKIPNLENGKQTLPPGQGPVLPAETDEKKLEGKEDRDKGPRKSFQERLRQSFLGRTFNKFVGKTESPEGVQKELTEKSTVEENLDDAKKTENLEAEANGDKSSESDTVKKKMLMESAKYISTKKNDIPEPTVPENSLPVEEDTTPKVDDAITTSPDSTNKEETDVYETTAVVPEEEQKKTELLASIIARQSSGLKVTSRAESKELSSRSIPADVTEKLETQVCQRESKVKEVVCDRGKQEPESRTCVTRHQELMKEITAEQHPDAEKDTVTVCMQCVQRKLSSKWSRQPPAMQPWESELRTICTTSKFPNTSGVCESFSFDNERLEESRYNCCCSLTSQYSDRHTDYPKSCLKKERQFCCIGSRETNSILYHDNRNWDECNCRRVLPCDNCRGPRNECSCRPTISCANCRKPKNECDCNAVCNARNSCRYMKSMFCLYCDNPREKCVCRVPLRKCSCCELSMDLCMCEDRKTYGDGRPVLTEPDNERTMYVTAWKPREEVRRYFSRNLENRRTDSVNECRCHEKVKSRNSDDLPYQRLPVFSDVMDELQQKISESTCCTQCRKSPCCCGIKAERDEGREERKMKYRVSPKTRRKIVAVCREKPRSKSPIVCNCDAGGQPKSEKQKKIIVPVCCACKSSPCRCRKTKSSQKKPRAKCYYCKSSPCVCIATRERSKPRPCRCADSPCRTKEKEIVPCGKTSTKPKNNEEKIICVR